MEIPIYYIPPTTAGYGTLSRIYTPVNLVLGIDIDSRRMVSGKLDGLIT